MMRCPECGAALSKNDSAFLLSDCCLDYLQRSGYEQPPYRELDFEDLDWDELDTFLDDDWV